MEYWRITEYLQGMPTYAHLNSKFDIQGQARFAYIYACLDIFILLYFSILTMSAWVLHWNATFTIQPQTETANSSANVNLCCKWVLGNALAWTLEEKHFRYNGKVLSD